MGKRINIGIYIGPNDLDIAAWLNMLQENGLSRATWVRGLLCAHSLGKPLSIGRISNKLGTSAAPTHKPAVDTLMFGIGDSQSPKKDKYGDGWQIRGPNKEFIVGSVANISISKNEILYILDEVWANGHAVATFVKSLIRQSLTYDETAVVDHYSPQPVAAADNAQAPAAGGGANRSTSSLTFGNFVIGDSNRMAYSMAVEVAESPGRSPLNPLFIYGKSGLGKTHLMRAIQNYIEETRPGMRTVYADSADFLSKHVEAARAHDREKSSYKDFKTYYEEADVLLIDDVQYLQGKTQTLDIVFQLFNTLTAQGKQVVLSADRMPKNIGIDERYYSRFSAGGVIDIQPPEIETKLGIVKSFADEYSRSEGLSHFALSDAIQMYIAENSSSNIRELKSAVTKVIYQMLLFNRDDMSIEEVRSLLENHFSGGPSRNLTIDDIQRAVESFFKVSRSDLVGPKRSRSVVYPRQIAIYLCRQLLDLPYNDIGKKFNRDHSTAMHSVASVEEMLKDNRGVQEEIEALQKIISEYSE